MHIHHRDNHHHLQNKQYVGLTKISTMQIDLHTLANVSMHVVDDVMKMKKIHYITSK